MRSCPGLAVLAYGVLWHVRTTNSSPLGRSLPGAPLGSSHASFCPIVLSVVGIWKRCKNTSVFSYMEIIAEKVLVWGKVISFLEGGEPGFSVCGGYNVGSHCDPARVSVGEEVVRLPACLLGARVRPGGGGSVESLRVAKRVGAAGTRVPGRLLSSSRPCWPQAISPPRASVSSSAYWGQPSWFCCHLVPRNGLKRGKRVLRGWVMVG